MPRWSTSALASSASSRDEYGPAGLLVFPMPRLSNISSRYPAAVSSASWKAQVSRSSASPLTSTIVSGPAPATR